MVSPKALSFSSKKKKILPQFLTWVRVTSSTITALRPLYKNGGTTNGQRLINCRKSGLKSSLPQMRVCGTCQSNSILIYITRCLKCRRGRLISSKFQSSIVRRAYYLKRWLEDVQRASEHYERRKLMTWNPKSLKPKNWSRKSIKLSKL